jgi:hypothetical protein
VEDNQAYIVFPARIWNIPIPIIPSGWGAITVDINDDHTTITNYSRPTHIFHQGSVDREIREVNGTWYVVTHGTGTNIRTPYPIVNEVIDKVNEAIGPSSFMYLVDQPMSTWVVVDQTIKDVGSLISGE